MALRFDDVQRVLTLSVGDLVDAGPARGHLLPRMGPGTARMALGREVHEALQQERGLEDARYEAEIRLSHQWVVDDWTVRLVGRVDGLTEEGAHLVIEEIKSTAMPAARLFETDLDDWPGYAMQLEVYVYAVGRSRKQPARGRLSLVSVVDGSRHSLSLMVDSAETEAWILERLRRLVRAREQRIAWMERRRAGRVPLPFDTWRAGQLGVVEAVQHALECCEPALVEAPTGLGKTAATLYAALTVARARDMQVFWATSRTTQQGVVAATLQRFVDRGLTLSGVRWTSRARACLQDEVDCRPEVCGYADSYYDKREAAEAVGRAVSLSPADFEELQALAGACEVCPWALARDSAAHVDVVVGDYNYVFDPDIRSARLFAEGPGQWIVVVDEAHQLVERIRGYRSPSLAIRQVRDAASTLSGDERFVGVLALVQDIEDAILEAAGTAWGRSRDGVTVTTLSRERWRGLAQRVEGVSLDYALIKAADRVPGEREDVFLDLCAHLRRFVSVLLEAGEETVHLAHHRPGREAVSLLCLDPSGFAGPWISALGGFVAISATLSPVDFYRDLLGLDPQAVHVHRVAGVFPAENRRVLVNPSVSTAWKDRARDADATSEALQQAMAAVPGNVAVFFSSFAMARDIAGRWSLGDRRLLLQEPSMDGAQRQQWLGLLAAGDERFVLVAVLGGIFGEGVDLPPHALDAVFVAGPAFPPVGMERDLLREFYESRYERGFLYSSLVPGMTRVVQAAGRLVRGPDDRGVVMLLGQRFLRRDIRALLPDDWDISVQAAPVGAIEAFFAEDAS